MGVSVSLKAIVPKRSFTALSRVIQAALVEQLRQVAEGIKKDFEATTATWKHQVKFDIRYFRMGTSPMARIATADEIYGYVNYGTRRHPIFPVRAKTLAFQGGPYKAKTSPGRIGSRGGGPSGPMVYPRYVKIHPGTEARAFDKAIQQKWQKLAAGTMQVAVLKGVAKW